jgi:hypothetical protein
MRATRGTDGEAVEHDALVQARAGLGVALARYWLALNRAQNTDGTTRTAALARARDELERATLLRRRVQALQAAQLADTPGSLELESAHRVPQPRNANGDRHPRNGILIGRLPARTCS